MIVKKWQISGAIPRYDCESVESNVLEAHKKLEAHKLLNSDKNYTFFENFEGYIFYEKMLSLHEEKQKINNVILEAKKQADINIENNALILLDKIKWEEKLLHKERKVNYKRLKALDMIDENE